MVRLLKKLKNSRAGLSLVELLIAVVILAIVAAPLLHAFVTSANVLNKSRRYGEATAAAQNVREVIETASPTAVIGGSANVQSLLGASAITPLSDTSCSISGIPGGGRSYEARVTYDNSPEVNSQELIRYTDMDATFAQSCLPDDNPDALALAEFRSLYPDAVSYSSTRSITMDLTRGDTGDSSLVFIRVKYDYLFSYTAPEYDSDGIATGNVVAGTPFPYSLEYALFPSGVSYADDPEAPLSVYLMYFPYYEGRKDTIVIKNAPDITAAFFLVKQWAVETQADGSQTKLAESAITAKENIQLTEISQYQSSGYSEGCSLFTNAGQNLAGTGATHLTYRIYKGSLWYTSAAGSITGDLAAKEAEDRFYRVTIEIYPDGSGLSGSPLYTLNTSKLK